MGSNVRTVRHNRVQAEKQLPHWSETILLLKAPLGLFRSGHIQLTSYSFSSVTIEVEVNDDVEAEEGNAVSNLVARAGVRSDLTGLSTHRTLTGFNATAAAAAADDEEDEENNGVDDEKVEVLFFFSFPFSVPSANAMTWRPSKLKNSNLRHEINIYITVSDR